MSRRKIISGLLHTRPAVATNSSFLFFIFIRGCGIVIASRHIRPLRRDCYGIVDIKRFFSAGGDWVGTFADSQLEFSDAQLLRKTQATFVVSSSSCLLAGQF